MTPVTPVPPARRNDRFRRAATAMAGTALLGLLAGLPARLEAQCTLSGSPASFEPNPPGVPRTLYLSPGYNNSLELYRSGAGGPRRLLMQESYGYSVLDLSNPVNPTALDYRDNRFGADAITLGGDGQSDVYSIGVSDDGQRGVQSLGGPGDGWYTIVGGASGYGFLNRGSFSPRRAGSTLVQHVGSRYIAYEITSTQVAAADVTTLPATFAQQNMSSENTGWPGGGLGSLAGNYILYQSGGSIRVVDASNPGPVGNITTSFPQTTITSVDFGGRAISAYSAAVDPADPTILWVLVELNAQAGENSPSYGLLYVTSSLAKVSAGPVWRVPSQAGEAWASVGVASALVENNGDLFVLMWAKSTAPTIQFLLYSTTAAGWASVPPGSFPVSGSGFALRGQMSGFGVAGTSNVYAYLPTTTTAYVIPMACVSQNAPAVAAMSAVNQAGTPLNSGDTVFLGERVTITPAINPLPVNQPLTGFGWNFDFDFHAGAASEDNGAVASPRIKAADNGAFGNPAAPPAQITVVGPCDYRVGGTDPNSGAGCWRSVTTNGAFGGPDFVAVPATGSSKAITFAFEANNALGSAGARLFTLNWKVPAAKLQTTQVLSGQPLVSASDGYPTATGFKWWFGDAPNALTVAGLCSGPTGTGPTCVPTLDTKGQHYYWLTATYANGYATPDYAGTAAMGTYTVTDFAPAFTVNGSATGPITAVINQSLTVQNSSQRGAAIIGSYEYSLCVTPCADSYQPWVAMSDPSSPSGSPPRTATIPIPGTAGNYALKIRVSYSGGQTAFWPDPAGITPFTVTVVSVVPLVVNVSVNPTSQTAGQNVTFSCNVTGGLTPYFYQWRSPLSFTVPGATQRTYATTSTSAGNLQAYCFVSDSQPIPAQSSGSATATFTGGGGGPPAGGVSVNVSVSPNPALVNQTVTFSCNASGGTGSYTYQWRSPSSSFTIPGQTNSTYQTSSSTPTTINAGCTATDGASAQASGAATVQISNPAGPPPACLDVNYTILDRDNGFIPIPPAVALGIQYFGVATGQNLAFLASGTGMTGADWTFGDGGTGSGNPIWYTYASAGTFNATVKLNANSQCSKTYRFIVAAPSGLFTARYADGSAFTSTQVESGKDLSFVATDTANLYAWDFGDGFTGTGKNPTHAFNVSGSSPVTFTTTLTVTIGSTSWSTSQTFTVLPPPEPPKWFVAGMAYLQGSLAGTLWQTDVTIFNPDPTRSATYSLAFLNGGSPVDPANLDWRTINLGAQQSISSPNVLAFFGQPLGSSGALLVRGDSAPVPPVLTARTFNIGDPTKGTFGLSVPSTQPSSGLTPQAAPSQQYLVGLRDDDTAYTNIGLMNVTRDWSHARLTFLDQSGAATFGQVNVDVPPYGVAQLTRPLSAAPPSGVGFPFPLDAFSVRVAVLSGGAVFPYATVIDLRSTDPIVVTASDRPSTTYRIPGIVRLQGANNTVWRSRFYITNPSSTSRKASISYSFVPCEGTVCKSRAGLQSDVTLLPGETLWADDFPKKWLESFGFTVSDTTAYQSAYIDVFPAAGDPNQEPLLVLGVTYNDQPAGPVGLQVPGFTDADAASKTGENKRLVLTGLVSTEAYRTNLALFAISGATGKWVNVHVYSQEGTNLRDLPVYVDGVSQVSNDTLFGGLSGDLSRLSVIVDNIDADVTVGGYATIVDNMSGDATFVKAQPTP